MKKLSPVGMKWLKIVHISLVALFFGGIMSSLALNMGLSLATYDDILAYLQKNCGHQRQHYPNRGGR